MNRDGNIYGIPCNADKVLQIRPDCGSDEGYVPGREEARYLGPDLSQINAQLSHRAGREEKEKEDGVGAFKARTTGTKRSAEANKWYGGITGKDGAVYGMSLPPLNGSITTYDDNNGDEYTNLCLSAPCSFDSYTPHIPPPSPSPSFSFLHCLTIPLL